MLTNPGGNPVTVDVTLHGAEGAVQTAQGKGLVVPARGRTAFLLDSISAAVIGDQLYAALRMRSSFVQASSPWTTASASICGCTAKCDRTSTGG